MNQMTRPMLMVLWLALAAACVGSAMGQEPTPAPTPAPAPAGGPTDDADPLAQLLAKSGLQIEKLGDEIWNVPFDAGEGQRLNVCVSYNDDKKQFVLIFATVVDREPNFDFNKEVLLAAMKLNNDYPVAKFCLNLEEGDLDCQTEVYLPALTPETLSMYVNLIAGVADEAGPDLNKLAGGDG